jgi:hypothetical protein
MKHSTSAAAQTLTRRSWTALALLVAAAVQSAPALAKDRLDPNDSTDNLAIEIGIACSSLDVKRPQFYFWTGKVFARRMGEADRHLFDVQGVNPRACQLLRDPARGGLGYQAAARELMIYLDPASNAVLRSWQNPWTGETVKVAQMVNEPASMRAPKFPLDESGKPAPFRMNWVDMGDFLVAERARSFFRDSPLGGEYQDFVGGKYSVIEADTMIVRKELALTHQSGRPLPYVATWTRISPWLPWMKMGGREGSIILITQGRGGSRDLAQLPEPLRSVIETEYPLMKEAPPFDDDRAFVNSWEAAKRWIDAERKLQDSSKAR